MDWVLGGENKFFPLSNKWVCCIPLTSVCVYWCHTFSPPPQRKTLGPSYTSITGSKARVDRGRRVVAIWKKSSVVREILGIVHIWNHNWKLKFGPLGSILTFQFLCPSSGLIALQQKTCPPPTFSWYVRQAMSVHLTMHGNVFTIWESQGNLGISFMSLYSWRMG